MRFWKNKKIINNDKIRIVASSYLNNDKKRFDLCKCFIYSILSQTYENFEVFIVHDGPIDDCPEKEELVKVINSDKRIKLFETAYKVGKYGYPHRKNYAFINEDFDWLIYTNDDNYYIPVALESFLSTAQEYNKQIVFCNMISSHRTWNMLNTAFKKSLIDMGCLFFKKNLIKNFDFDLTDSCFEADGNLVDNIANNLESKEVIKLNNILFVHN